MQLMHSLKYRVCMENEYMHAYFTLFPTLLTFVGTTGGGLHPRGWPAVRVVFTKRACIYANELPRRSVQRIRKGKEALAARRPKGRLGPSLRSAASSATLLQSWHHVCACIWRDAAPSRGLSAAHAHGSNPFAGRRSQYQQ